MSHGRHLTLTDAACLQAETFLSPRIRGMRAISLDKAEDDVLESLPVAARLCLIIPVDRALVRSLFLPLGTDATKALPIWLEDVAPWASGSYLWDAVQSGDGTDWIVALVPKSLVQPVEARIERRGSEIAEILLFTEEGRCFRLRHNRAGYVRLRWTLRSLALSITVIGIGLTLWQGQRAMQARDLLAKTEVAMSTANTASGSASQTVQALADAKVGSVPIAISLALIAARLPRDAWLVRLTLDGRDFTLSGRSATPETIIPALSAKAEGAFIRRAEFAGPIARDAQSGLFSFTITGEVVAGGKP